MIFFPALSACCLPEPLLHGLTSTFTVFFSFFFLVFRLFTSVLLPWLVLTRFRFWCFSLMLRRFADVGACTSSNVTLLIFFCGDVASLIGETFHFAGVCFGIFFLSESSFDMQPGTYNYSFFCILKHFSTTELDFCSLVKYLTCILTSCFFPPIQRHIFAYAKVAELPRTSFKVVLKCQKFEFISD